MERKFTILVGDRNRRVRQFLRREFLGEGYRVLVAEGVDELSGMIRQTDGTDLVILDDEMLALNEGRVLEQLENRIPPLPFIVHSFSPECVDATLLRTAAAVVEKKGDIQELKRTARQVLTRRYPCREQPSALRPDCTDGRSSG